MNPFEFATAARVVFGEGRATELGTIARGFGQRIVLLTGRNAHRHDGPLRSLESAGVYVHPIAWSAAHSEPDLDFVVEVARQVRETRAECVIGLGGGGVLDTAKAAAALATNHGDPLTYLEVVGRGEPLRANPLPVIALPTTAGTGSEVTRNAVLNVPSHRAKVSLRHPLMLPRVALVDPELTYSVPADLTVSTGMDAFTQCLEPIVCSRANPMADAIAWMGLERAARSLRAVHGDGADVVSRHDLALASVCGGMALANAGLGAVHGLAGPLGGLFPNAAHGALCSALLAPVMHANIQALRQRAPKHPSLNRYQKIARRLTHNNDATADAGVEWVRQLAADLGIRGLNELGLPATERGLMIERSLISSSMKSNPIALTAEELSKILTDAGLE